MVWTPSTGQALLTREWRALSAGVLTTGMRQCTKTAPVLSGAKKRYCTCAEEQLGGTRRAPVCTQCLCVVAQPLTIDVGGRSSCGKGGCGRARARAGRSPKCQGTAAMS